MIFLLIVISVLVFLVFYYKEQARYFESLFELSKSYNHYDPVKYMASKFAKEWRVPDEAFLPPKLNKDGSIAKKRGRKAKNEPRD